MLNFSHSYSDYENPVRVNANSPEKFISMTTPHDILTTDREVEFHLVSSISVSLVVIYKYTTMHVHVCVYQLLCIPGFELSQLSCTGSSVGRAPA